MALVAPKQEKKFILQANIEPGVYPGRLVQVIDLGLQAQKPYQGKDKEPAHEIMLTYELVDEFMKDEAGEELPNKPRWIGETFPLRSLEADKAKSTARYLALDPDKTHGGDFSKLIGTAVGVIVVNNQVGERVYDNVAGLSPMRPKDAKACPELKNPSKVFDLDAPNMEVFTALPEWVQTKIKANLRFKNSKLDKLLGGKAPAVAEEEPPFDVDEEAGNSPY